MLDWQTWITIAIVAAAAVYVISFLAGMFRSSNRPKKSCGGCGGCSRATGPLVTLENQSPPPQD